ncbi:MAG: hypothetical protein JWP44_225, partial [Mucilaginibacter sp.]|nr:hypothetical protein [Mucilaginibacter sp.]
MGIPNSEIHRHLCKIMNIQPIISEQFNATIWRMEIDELSDIIVLELRNNADRKVFFGSMSLQSGVLHFKELTSPERWLTGMEAAYDGVLLLHYYESETGPVHKGLLAIDAHTGETLWSNYNYAFDHLSAKGPVVFDTRIQPRKLFLAAIKTGATNGVYDPSVNRELTSSIVVPAVITPEEIPGKLLTEQPFGNMVHYLEYNNLRFVSLHALQSGRLTQSIFVFDGIDKVYEDLLNTDIQKVQPEAFILHK